MQKGKVSLLVILALCLLGVGATATATTMTVSPVGQMTTTEPGAVTLNFTSGIPSGYTVNSHDGRGDYGVIPGGQWVYPTGDKNPYLDTGIGSISIDLATVASALGIKGSIDYFGLYWGSIDTYNAISFWDGSTEVKSYTGWQVASAAAADGIPVHFGSTSLFVNFFAGGNQWTSIELSSSEPAFESDNHAFGGDAVPEPGTMALMGIGLLGVALVFRRYTNSNGDAERG
jgi:hypothetical protein